MRSATRILLIAILLVTMPEAAPAEASKFVIAKNAKWKYYATKSKPPQDWNQPTFDDQKWKSGAAGFGYGDGDDRTILNKMRGQYTAVYIRSEFEIDPSDADTLYLYLKFDDGFIAYLNGKRIASQGVVRDDGGLRVDLHEAGSYEEYVIKNAGDSLKRGKNVLAVEGHNADIRSSDFSLDPVLVREKLAGAEPFLGVDEYLADLEHFEQRLFDQSSYLTRRGVDLAPQLRELRASINEETRLAQFTVDLKKLVMQIGDCHAGVYSGAARNPGGYLPLRPADTADGLAAMSINRNELLDADCPYIDSLDGVPLNKWLDAAAQHVSRGSPQFVRARSLQRLGFVGELRRELQLPASETITIGLRSVDGSDRTEKKQRLTRQGYSVASIALKRSRTLDGNIGYLRIPSMDNRMVRSVVGQIQDFRDTDGLIIDVRDNGGGTYAILRAIYGFFVSEDARPYVTNIAAYRLSERFRSDHIHYRPTYRLSWEGWNDVEREAIRQAATDFEPEWQPPARKFSEWHYMVLSRDRGKDLERGIVAKALGRERVFYHYNKSVVVLSNAGSFSATDGFLSAFADLPQVTVVGGPSGGGSGATRRFQLPNTGVMVALSSMASFRANGKLFDGNGVDVDVVAKPRIADYLSDDTDSVLQRGLSVITSVSNHRLRRRADVRRAP